MSTQTPFDCYQDSLHTPLPSQARKRMHGSVTNLYSQKRRRVSMISADLAREIGLHDVHLKENVPITVVDRFVPLRPKTYLPLTITPRTNRISKQFGLTDDRLFKFRDDQDDASNSGDTTLKLLRQSASSLFDPPRTAHQTSVTENLNKRRQCIITLDSPGIPMSPDGFPLTWSKRNLIAVACGTDVFYQNLESKTVSHFFNVASSGQINAIEWAGEGRETQLAAGTTRGFIQVRDAINGPRSFSRTWRDSENQGVKSFSWNGDVLAVGTECGAISLFDVRAKKSWNRTEHHREDVMGVKWSFDGNFLASGDFSGVVHIWDKRAAKNLLELGTRNAKMRHRAAVKALAWCPWKPDLLATGSYAPEGKIRVWSMSESVTSACPAPVETFPLNTSVLSLHWSPHCKELLSTHGPSFVPTLARRRSTSSLYTSGQRTLRKEYTNVKFSPSPLSNSIAVHEYPSGKRLLTLTNAHQASVTHSCLSPNGEHVFTVSPGEETIKMWQVWAKRSEVEKPLSAFSNCAIR